MPIAVKALLALLAGLEIIDGVATHLMVRAGEVSEGNPLMAPLLDGGGFVALKMAGAGLCVSALYLLFRRFPRLTIASAVVVSLFYVAVLAWNVGVVMVA